jgi:hypothetical protein
MERGVEVVAVSVDPPHIARRVAKARAADEDSPTSTEAHDPLAFAARRHAELIAARSAASTRAAIYFSNQLPVDEKGVIR